MEHVSKCDYRSDLTNPEVDTAKTGSPRLYTVFSHLPEADLRSGHWGSG